MNRLFQQLNTPEQARRMAAMFKGAGNPQAVITNMVNNNPNLKPVMDMVRGGSNPKDLFYSMARQKGVDPESILGLLR